MTTHGNVVSIHIQFTPYALKDGGWGDQSPDLERLVLDALEPHLPKLRASITDRKLLTPLDLETTYGLTEGDLNHGQLMLDQFLFMRPMPGWSNHRTPIDNLYLCGSGVHGGGGVSGAAGRNAAKVLRQAKLKCGPTRESWPGEMLQSARYYQRGVLLTGQEGTP